MEQKTVREWDCVNLHVRKSPKGGTYSDGAIVDKCVGQLWVIGIYIHYNFCCLVIR